MYRQISCDTFQLEYFLVTVIEIASIRYMKIELRIRKVDSDFNDEPCSELKLRMCAMRNVN